MVKVVTRKEIGKNITNSQKVTLFTPNYWNPGIDLQNKESLMTKITEYFHST